MARTNKPASSATFASANTYSFGPFYAMRENTGTTCADDSGAGAGTLSFNGTTSWTVKSTGPEVTVAAGYLQVSDSSALRRASSAITVVVGITESFTGVNNYNNQWIFSKRFGYNQTSYGISTSPGGSFFAPTTAHISTSGGDLATPSDSAPLTAGVPYLMVLRWASGYPLNMRIYNRDSGALVHDLSSSGSATGTIDYDGGILRLGLGSDPDANPDPSAGQCTYGDYDFFGISDRSLTNTELDAIVADPWSIFASVSVDKPLLSAPFLTANTYSFGPFYGLRAGGGSSSLDDSPSRGPSFAFQGGAAWVSKTHGPEVRLSSAGSYLTAPDHPVLRRPSSAITVVLGASLSGQVNAAGNVDYNIGNHVSKDYATGYNSWVIGGNPDTHRAMIRLGPNEVATATTSSIPINTPYFFVMRWQSGQAVRLQIFDRSTKASVADVSSSVGTGVINYDSGPLTIGRRNWTDAGINIYHLGDYEFLGVSDYRWSDADVTAFLNDPWGVYGPAVGGDYVLFGPTGGLPTVASDPFQVVLERGVNPGGTVTVTPHMATMPGTFSASTVSLTNTNRTATFTFTPDNAASANGSITLTDDSTLADPPAYTFAVHYDAPAMLGAFESHLAWPVNVQPYVGNPGTYLNGDEHYDTLNTFQEARDYSVRRSLTVTDFSAQIASAVARYRDNYILPNGNWIQEYHRYNRGMAVHYLETGDIESRDASLAISGMFSANDFYYGKWPWFASRENIFHLLAELECERLGKDHAVAMEMCVSKAKGHIDQWTAPPGQRFWGIYVRPFMVALTCDGLISYYDRYRASSDSSIQAMVSDIPTKIKTALDWLWDHCWQNSNGTMGYTDLDTTTLSSNPINGTINTVTSGTVFAGDSGLSTQDNYYVTAYLEYPIGVPDYNWPVITAYNGSTRTISLSGTTTSNLTVGQPFKIRYQSADGGGPNNGTEPAWDLNHLICPAYAWYYRYTALHGARDMTYRLRHDALFNGGTMCWGAPSGQKQYNQATRWLFRGFDWRSQGDTPWAAATTYAVTAADAATGHANVPSGRLIVTLTGAQTSLANPVTITPHVSTGRGSFLPATAQLTTDQRKSLLRFVPDIADSDQVVSISFTNDGGLADPAPISYTVTSALPVATGFVAIVAASGSVGVPAPITLRTSPAGSVLPVAWLRIMGGLVSFEPRDSYNGGLFFSGYSRIPQVQTLGPDAKRIWLSSERPTFAASYAASSTGSKTIGFYDFCGIDPTPSTHTYQSNSAAGATSFTVTAPAPASGPAHTESGDFVITPNGQYWGTITPSDGGAGGSFTPGGQSWGGTADPRRFTYIPAGDGSISISFSANPSLTAPGATTYTAGSLTAATSYTVTPPSPESGTTDIPSAPFVVTPNGGYSGRIRLADSGMRGAFSPTELIWWGTEDAKSYTYTPVLSGSSTIGTTSAPAITDPSTSSYTVTSTGTATAYTLTGPSQGAVGSASGNFTVTPNDNYTGTITPNSGSGGGTFSPTSLTWSGTAESQTFTYTPASSGTKTIACTSSPALTNPAAVSFAALNAATDFTIGVVEFGYVGRPVSVVFTPNGIYTGVVTPNDSDAGGSFSPATLTWSGTAQAQSTSYTPASAGTKSITATCSPSTGIDPFDSVVLAVYTPATSATLTAPSPASGLPGVASGNFTVTPNSYYSGVITPNSGGVGGTFTPPSLTWSFDNTAKTFTYTPPGNGVFTISVTSSPTLSNPAGVTYTAAAQGTAYTLTGPLYCYVGNGSGNFTVTPNGTYTGTITPNDNGAGGTFDPVNLTWSGVGGAKTFTYTPASGGTKTISCTSSPTLSSPASLTVTAVPAATSYTLTGPSSGAVGVDSSDFTVTFNGWYYGGVDLYDGTGTTKEGSFTPTFLAFGVDYAQSPDLARTFKYHPVSAGAKSVHVVADTGAMSEPAAVTYTAYTTATSYTLTAPTPASGVPSVASGNFTVTPNAPYTGTITPSSGGGGGTFNPTSLSWSDDQSAKTFTYTPASTGAKTIATTSSPAISNPTSVTYTVYTAATSYTLTAPSPASGVSGVASGNFTVTPNNPYTGTIAPSAGGGGGTFSPTSLTWSAEQSAKTFTYTPASTGTKTISTTSSPGITDPAAVTYLSYVVATSYTITPPSPASGGAGIESGNFTITPNGHYTGTITLSSGAAGGTFNPSSLTWANSAQAQTFTFTPTSIGDVSIEATSSPGITDPSAATYSVTSGGETYTLGQIAGAVWQNTVVGNYTAIEIFRAMAAVLLGDNVSGGLEFKSLDGTKTVIQATVDGQNNRTITYRDLT